MRLFKLCFATIVLWCVACGDRETLAKTPYDASARTLGCTTYSPVVDAQVPVTLAEPLASRCADYLAHPTASPSKGPIPPEAIDARGREIWALIPDFVAVAGKGDEIPGYVSKFDLNCSPCDDPIPVVDESLRYVVGHMVPGEGFVPLRGH